MKTIIIGDLHGCYRDTIELLKECDYSMRDRVIFLGDLIDRGPDNDKCVDLAMQLQEIQQFPSCVMGNHEEKHLFVQDYVEKHRKLPEFLKNPEDNRLKARNQLSKRHFEFFKQMPTYLELPEYNTICVHAGMYPGRTPEQQLKKHLLHIQTMRLGDDATYWASRAPDHTWKYWTNYWNGPQRVVFGHSVLTKPLHTDKLVGLDGGAVFGLTLNALVLPDNKIVTIQSKMPKTDRANMPKYLVQDDIYVFS